MSILFDMPPPNFEQNLEYLVFNIFYFGAESKSLGTSRILINKEARRQNDSALQARALEYFKNENPKYFYSGKNMIAVLWKKEKPNFR